MGSEINLEILLANRTYIADLGPTDLVEGVYMLQNCQLGQTRNGKPFLKCLLGDKSGKVPGRMWNASEELFRMLPTDGFVWIQGQSQAYQGEIQIIIQQISGVDPSETDLAELLPSTKHDIETMLNEVKSILGGLKHPAVRALAQAYLADEALMAKVRRAPAAMTLHHAYLGGLLEHTLSLLRLADAMLPLYPQLNPDIIRLGIFIHDLGKCEELTWETGFGYTEDGQLVGHIARGLVWLNDKARHCAAKGTKIPAAILRVLEHIIISHHGQPEFGALKIPATPEALAIHLLDNVDAKLQMAISATRGDGARSDAEMGGSFTEKIWALDTRFYRPDPTTVPDPVEPAS